MDISVSKICLDELCLKTECTIDTLMKYFSCLSCFLNFWENMSVLLYDVLVSKYRSGPSFSAILVIHNKVPPVKNPSCVSLTSNQTDIFVWNSLGLFLLVNSAWICAYVSLDSVEMTFSWRSNIVDYGITMF